MPKVTVKSSTRQLYENLDTYQAVSKCAVSNDELASWVDTHGINHVPERSNNKASIFSQLISSKRHHATVKWVLEQYNPDIYARDANGLTVIHKAVDMCLKKQRDSGLRVILFSFFSLFSLFFPFFLIDIFVLLFFLSRLPSQTHST